MDKKRYIDVDKLEKEGWTLQRYVTHDSKIDNYCDSVSVEVLKPSQYPDTKDIEISKQAHICHYKHGSSGFEGDFCSRCEVGPVHKTDNFCPNCGAKFVNVKPKKYIVEFIKYYSYEIEGYSKEEVLIEGLEKLKEEQDENDIWFNGVTPYYDKYTITEKKDEANND